MRTTWLVLAFLLPAASAPAVTSTRSVGSTFGGNGHNVSFDGRLFIVRDGAGWQARVLRPEAVTYLSDGLPDAMGPMWSSTELLLGPPDVVENALAICEPDPTRAPYKCNAAGDPSASGAFDCYDVIIIDSDAVTPAASGGAVLRRRQLTAWIANPKTASAHVDHFAWGPTITALSPQLRGIEPTVTADGRLMVWQGHPNNDGSIDILMYSVNATPCAATGWSAGKVISRMATDPAVMGTYRIAERALRAADGTPFAAGALVHGAYPWIMASGDAIVFTGAPMPCRGAEDPPGCGPRRNALAVVGYPTNWGIAHIDGGVNPSTTDTVRLFFSSPGPTTFPGFPVTEGIDVWPFFGSNTSNYVELVFDDGLDGEYAGMWHMNESINAAGDLDPTRSPDVSGYFNTAVLHGGMSFAAANDGVVGKALTFDGVDDRLEVASASSLFPVNGITIDLWMRPQNPDCDANPNYRLLIGKGNIGGDYSVIFEENGSLHARVKVGGVEQELWGPPVAFDAWTHVSFEYDGPSGKATWFYDDVEVATANLAVGQLSQSTTAPLQIGGPGPRAACPNGDGAYPGQLDEVSISRVARRTGTQPPTPDAGPGEEEIDAAGPGPGEPDAGGPGAEDPGGGCCRTGSGAGAGTWLLAVLVFSLAAGRRAGRGRRRPGS